MLFSSLTVALTVFTAFPVAFGQDTSLAEVKKAFQAAHVCNFASAALWIKALMPQQIPQNASLTFNPTALLEVQFPQASGPPVHVKVGTTLLINRTCP